METPTYIHFGSTCFDIARFCPISNIQHFNKPHGGLWASPKEADYGWEDWCVAEDFKVESLNKSFAFILEPTAKILTIQSITDLESLPRTIKNQFLVCIDFEKLAEDFDAIEVKMSMDSNLYYALLGWDCDSILVMNPTVIRTI